MPRKTVLSTTFRAGREAEKWTARSNGQVFVKQTVRVKKGDPSGRGGQFMAATNYRGTVIG